MNSRLNNKTKVLAKLGTFWTKNTSREEPYGLPLVRAITRALDEDNARPRMVESGDLLVGDPARKANYEIPFYPTEVIAIPSDTDNITVNAAGRIVLRATGDEVAAATWTNTQTAHYVMRMPSGLSPISIRSSVGDLVAGVSFSAGEGWIRFFLSPHDIFPDRMLHVRAAVSKEPNILDYTLKVDEAYGALPFLAEYYRSSHSAEAFERALNELAGRVIIKNDCLVVEAKYAEVSGTYFYTTDDGNVYKVSYEHFPIEAGTQLYAKQIIGQAIDVFTKSRTGGLATWWEAPFSGSARGNSINLQDLNPALPDVTIANEEVTFWAYEAVDTTFHVRADFTGDPGDLDTYFEIVKQGELWSGTYWNDVLGFTTVLEDDEVNGLAFMFEHALYNAVVIDIDTHKLGETMADRIAYIARREAPVGCVPIIRKWSSVA